ncbi:glycosyltransferase family 2 protein [Pseudomonas pseudonitroreducens]|uniref:glycosyltransferase family 2 protein n=1 Tax=Pseudomonas pseudonitroreducens TaxID=2892326 RepID=UPI001F3AAAE0|nr:glycosyltransferase [Pseudomonas pseudonitroreducens]
MKKIIHVVIIDYFKADQVKEAIDSIRKQSYDQSLIDITVIDNSCNLKNFTKLSEIRDIKLIKSLQNIGYVSAVNKALREHQRPSDITLLLNPDILFPCRNSFSILLNNFKNSKCHILGPSQINHDGSRPSTVRNYPHLKELITKRTLLKYTNWGKSNISNYLMADFDYSKKQAVPWLQSSCVFIRTEFLNKANFLNEKYKLFMADIEICRTAYNLGGEVIYDPTIQVIADGVRCSDGGVFSLFKSRALRIHIIDALKYYLT